MSEYIDERIVSIKFDNSGFAEGVSETQKQLDSLNKSLEFDGAAKGVDELSKAFKDVSNEAKKTDLSPIGDAVENIGEKFNALKTIATGVFLKIGADAVEMGKKLIKSVSIDPISQGFEKYQSILTSQMTLTAALGGKTEEEIESNSERIKEVLDELAWYADETAYSLDDMVKNVSQFANYGIDLEDAKTAMMGIANASAKSGAPLAMASHAMEGFSKAMGQGYMSYQVWRTWLNSSKITTLDFKQTMIDTAKAFAKEAGSIGNAAYENGELIVDMGKTMGKVQVTAENLESTLTKGRWLTKDVMLAALSKYSAAMDDFYEATDHGKTAVSELFENSEAGFDKFSTEAFKYAQQCKTLNDVIEALFDATSTTWYRIFQSLIGDYKQTVSMWSDFAEYLFEWFVYPLQDVASMIKEFAESNSNIMDEQTGKMMTMRDVIVDSFMNIMEAISSVINPIREAFETVFHPFETIPEKLQNGVEKFHAFTESLILTKDEAEKLRNKFIAFFNVIKAIGEIVKKVIDLVKKYVWPIVKKVASFAINIIKTIGTALIKLISTVSSFISRVFGVRDIVADIKEDILSAAEAIDEMTEASIDNAEVLDRLGGSYTSYNDLLDEQISKTSDLTSAIDDLTDAEEKNSKSKSKKEKDYTIPGGYDGTTYLSYYQAIEKANNKTLAEFIKEKGITEKQYEKVIEMLKKKDEGEAIYLSDMADASGLSISTMSELSKIIDQTTVAYDKSDKAISDILNKDAEAKKWETIWDGINEAQKATLITYGDEQAALQLYFKQGIKDYSEIAKMIGLEEWKVRRVISAYEEAYAVEELLAKQKKEVNADNIDAARQELGYITRKTEEKKKEQKLTERDKSIAERNARIQERNERLGIKTNRTTSNSVSVIGNAIRQIPIIGTAFDMLSNVFGCTSKATTKSSESINKSIHSVKDYVDEIPYKKFITTRDNFYEVKESADDTTESIDQIAESGSKAEKALKTSTSKMSKYFKDLEGSASESSDSINESLKKNNKSLESGSKGKGSLASEIGTIFGENGKNQSEIFDVNSLKDKFYEFIEWLKDKFVNGFNYIKEKVVNKFNEIKDKAIDKLKELKTKSLKEIFDPIISKIQEIWITFQNVFSNIGADLENFFKEPAQTIGKIIEDIKIGFKSLFSKEDEEVGIGLSASDILGEETENQLLASIDDMLDKVWEKIKTFFKSRVDAARNDADNPFYGLVHMMDNVIDWWDDFTYDIQVYIKRIKAAFNVIFGEGSFFDKLSNGALWRPALDFVDGLLTKIDNLQMNIKNFKNAIKEGIDDALKNTDINITEKIKSIKGQIEGLWEKCKEFIENIKTAKEIISGGGGGAGESSEETPGGLAGVIGNMLAKWDEFKEKLKEGLDWDTIVKVSELESILERLVKAVGTAWIKIGIGQMAIDIGNFFGSIGDGIRDLSDSLTDKKDLGKVLLEIATAIAILAGSFFALGQMDADAIKRATDAIQALSAILVPVFTVVAGFTRLMQSGNGGMGNAKSIPQALGNGLQNMFGQKNTMRQAAALIVGIAAGIYIISEAFVVLGDTLKDMSPDEIKKTEEVLAIMAGIIVGALIIIRVFLGRIGGGGGISGGINIENKTIQKTISPIAETLKGFALALATLVAGFIAISIVIDKYFTNDDGSMNVGKFAAATITLAAMAAVVIAMIIVTTKQAKKLQGYDPKLLKQFEKIMNPFVVGIATMIYGFQTLTKTIDKIKKDDTFGKSVGVFIGMLVAVILFMLVTVALCKWMLGEKTSEAHGFIKKYDAPTAIGNYTASFDQVKNYAGGKNDIQSVLSEVSKIIISLGFGVKLIASAFSTLVTAIDGISDAHEKTFSRAIGVFIGIFAAIILLIAALTISAKLLQPGDVVVIKAIGTALIEIGAAVILIEKGIGDLAKTFAKIAQIKGGEEAINKALIVIGVFIGGLILLFAVIAALSATGVGGAALAAAAAILVAIATALLEIGAAVYVFAKGLEVLVNVLIKVASANKEIEKGIDNLIKLMPKVKTLIVETMKAIIGGLIEGLIAYKADIAKFLVETLDSILDTLAKYLPKIADKLDEIKEPLNKICDWIGDFVKERFHHFVENAETMREDLTTLFSGAIRLLIDSINIGIIEGATDTAIALVEATKIILDVIDTELPGILERLKSIIHQIREFIIWEIDDFLDYCETKATTWADGLTDIIVAIINGVEQAHQRITDAIESLMLTWADDIVSLFETRGKVIGKLLTIPGKVISAIVTEFKNLLKGGSLFEQIFGDMGEGDSIEAKAGNMWERVEKIFTDKDHAGINEAEQISESAKKWGIYIANGVAKGLDTVPSDLQSNADSLWKAIKEAYDKAAGLNENGSANTSGASYKLGENTAKGILKGLKDFAKNKETKAAAEALWKEIDKQFRKSAKIKSPSKESYKWGKYIGMGLTNGLEKSSQDVGKAAIDMWETFYEPMEENIESFAAVTSSMLSQLLDANMDVNPVITPVFDMSNLDAASSSMSAFFDAQDALEVAGSFNGMQKSRMELENNQNEGDSATGSGPTYNYVQNNYSPKALSAIEIYRKTKNQLNFRTYAGG